MRDVVTIKRDNQCGDHYLIEGDIKVKEHTPNVTIGADGETVYNFPLKEGYTVHKGIGESEKFPKFFGILRGPQYYHVPNRLGEIIENIKEEVRKREEDHCRKLTEELYKEIDNLNTELSHLKRERGFEERLVVLFTGRV